MTYHHYGSPRELYEGHFPDSNCDCKGCIRDRGVQEWLNNFLRSSIPMPAIPAPIALRGHAPNEGCDGETCSANHGGSMPDDLGEFDEEVQRRLRKLRGEEEVPEARALIGIGPYRSMPLAMVPHRPPLKGWKLFKHKLRRLWWAFLLHEQGRLRKRRPCKCKSCGKRSKQWVMGHRWMNPRDPRSDIEPTYACPRCQADNTPDPGP